MVMTMIEELRLGFLYNYSHIGRKIGWCHRAIVVLRESCADIRSIFPIPSSPFSDAKSEAEAF